MRKIKFRGICIDKGTINSNKMVFGNLVEVEEKYYIVEVLGKDSFIWNEVDSETVGQYVRLKDKKENKIYTGDILQDEQQRKWIVIDVNGGFVVVRDIDYFSAPFHQFRTALGDIQNNSFTREQTEIIGNIHDNPNLIKI